MTTMKVTTMTKCSRSVPVVLAAAMMLTAGGVSSAQELFREAFDSTSSEGNWGVNANSSDYSAIFGYDYGTNEAVPEAPNTRPGDTATSGVILEANISAPGAGAWFTLFPLGQNFTGNYQLRFDAWMNYDVDEAVNGSQVGTTEFLGGGIGHDGVTADVASGAQAIVTSDGDSASDWRAFKDGFFVPAVDMAGGSRNNTDPYYADFLPGVVPPQGQDQVSFIPGNAGVPGFQWITWEFTAIDNVVDVTIEKPTGDRLLIATLDGNDTSDGSSGFTSDGNISLFYADFFSSVSPRSDLTFGVIDNVEVNVAVAPTLDGDYNEDDVVDLADYTLWRDNVGAAEGTLPNDPNAGPIGAAQYATWKANFGTSASAALAPLATAAVPEPGSLLLVLTGLAAAVWGLGRRR